MEVLPNEINKYPYLKDECGLTQLKENHENRFKDFNSVYDFEGDENLLLDEKFLFLQFAWLKPYVKIDFFPLDFVKKDKLDDFKANYVITKYQFHDEMRAGKKNFDSEFKVQNEKIGLDDGETEYMNYGIDYVNLLPIWIFKTDETFPLSSINFENYEFKCPKNPQHYLSVLYGDNYMELPDIIEIHNNFPFMESQFASIDEMNNKFKKDIEYLRKINDEFE